MLQWPNELDKLDIVLLVQHFVDVFARRIGKHIEHIPDKTLNAFMSYPWPGNIRELQNVVERAVIPSDDGVLLNPLPPMSTNAAASSAGRTTLEDVERAVILETLEASEWVVGGPRGAAAKLGLARTTSHQKMNKHGICRPGNDATQNTDAISFSEKKRYAPHPNTGRYFN